MIRMRYDSFEFLLNDEIKLKEEDTRYITFSYNKKIDQELVHKILEFLNEKQPNCTKCKHYYIDGCLGSYQARACKIHGNLEYSKHPMHDGDATKCPDYSEKKKILCK